MRLAELSAAERRYLSSPLAPVDVLTPLLLRHLSRVLYARMKQRVQIQSTAPAPDLAIDHVVDRAAPEIRWENGLEAMWLRGRLGGHYVASKRCAALSRNLLRTLQLALAETWISLSETKTLPAVLTLRVEMPADNIGVQHAALVVYFPSSLIHMDRWAQRIIHHEY